jgi:GT2 family glycosyltransferase
MIFAPTVSLIIVSRKRPAALRRVLLSLHFQKYQNFEVIVVADTPDAGFLSDVPHVSNICYIHFDEANISAARNIGIVHAKGDIVAFCDDDAVPDPDWLDRLVQPFEIAEVASAGGFVRGRNGISFQWKAMLSDLFGDDHPFTLDESATFKVIPFDGQKFLKLQGTNCAMRREALVEIGGFDEGFQFFLDETDVCLRLAQANYKSALIPKAQVQHGFEASEQRSQSRVPHTLFDIGASKRRFLEKHAKTLDQETAKIGFFYEQRNRLIGLMIQGQIEPSAVAKLFRTLESGFATQPVIAVSNRQIKPIRGFQRFGHGIRKTILGLAGSHFSNRKMLKMAVRALKNDSLILVMSFSITSLFHRRFFDERGFWMQKGGLFGKSIRKDSQVAIWTIKGRASREFENVKDSFPISEILVFKIFRNFVTQKTNMSGTN